MLATPDITVCRQLSFPASVADALYGWLQQLTWPETWSQGIEPGAASVDDIVAIFEAMTDIAVNRGCRVVGQVIELATDSIPAWALLCDGSTYANVAYPELAAVIGAEFKTDSTHFRTPDRVNRFGMGGPPNGVQGGENTHTLTETEIPAHTHTEQGFTVELSSVCGAIECLSAAPITQPTGSAGGGGSHNNLPQYEGTTFVIVATSND